MLQVQRPFAIYGHGRWLTVAVVVGIVLPSLGLLVTFGSEDVARTAYRLQYTAFSVAGVAVVRSSPTPSIDVWYLLQHATHCVAHGCDPYAVQTPASPQLTDGFPYLPGTAYVLTPFRILLGDVRYGEVAALLIVALLLPRVFPGRFGMVAATLVLATPCTLFAIEQAWIEPLLLAALVAVAWAWQRESSRGIIVALATAFSLKQHVALLAPLALCFLGWRRTIFAALAAGVACAPLVLWNLDAFWRTAVRVFYDLPARGDSLSLYIAAGPAVRGWLPYLLLAFGYECVATLAPRNLHGWLVSSGLLLGLFDLANKFSFFNEWALPAMLLAAGGAGAIATRDASVDRSIEV